MNPPSDLTDAQLRELRGIDRLRSRRGIPTCDMDDQEERADLWGDLMWHGLITVTETRSRVLTAEMTDRGRQALAA